MLDVTCQMSCVVGGGGGGGRVMILCVMFQCFAGVASKVHNRVCAHPVINSIPSFIPLDPISSMKMSSHAQAMWAGARAAQALMFLPNTIEFNSHHPIHTNRHHNKIAHCPLDRIIKH